MINESVVLAARNFGCLNEMFIEGKRNLVDGAKILAYRSKIWVLPPGTDLDDASKRMETSIRREAKLRKSKFNVSIEGPLHDRPDILQAEYSKSGPEVTLIVNPGGNYQHDPELSILVKKVAQTLGAHHVIRGDMAGNRETFHRTGELKAVAPTYAYHGTSTRNLKQILKTGIVPRPDRTNFDRIKHEDHIFLTTSLDKATFHAGRACQESKDKHRSGYGSPGVKTNDSGELLYQPIILKVRIPDPNLIDADYDIDRESEQKVYGKVLARTAAAGVDHSKDKNLMPGDSRKLSKSMGVFGYKGRILPQNIMTVMIGPRFEPDSPPDSTEGAQDYRKFEPSEVRKAFELAAKHDFDLNEVDLKDFINMPNEFIQQPENEDG